MPDDAPDPSNAHEGEPSEEEKLFAKVEALKEKTRVSDKLPDVPDWNFQRPASGPGSKPRPGPSDGGLTRSFGVGLTVAYTMAGSVIAGFGLGFLVDRVAHTGTTWSAILGIGGTLLGLVATVVMINRMGSK